MIVLPADPRGHGLPRAIADLALAGVTLALDEDHASLLVVTAEANYAQRGETDEQFLSKVGPMVGDIVELKLRDAVRHARSKYPAINRPVAVARQVLAVSAGVPVQHWSESDTSFRRRAAIAAGGGFPEKFRPFRSIKFEHAKKDVRLGLSRHGRLCCGRVMQEFEHGVHGFIRELARRTTPMLAKRVEDEARVMLDGLFWCFTEQSVHEGWAPTLATSEEVLDGVIDYGNVLFGLEEIATTCKMTSWDEHSGSGFDRLDRLAQLPAFDAGGAFDELEMVYGQTTGGQ